MDLYISIKNILKRHKGKISVLFLLGVFLVLTFVGYILYSYHTYPGRLPSKYSGTLIESLYENRRSLDGDLSLERIIGEWIPLNSELDDALHYLESIGFTITGIEDYGAERVDVYLVNFVSSNLFMTWQFMITLNCRNGVIISRSAFVLGRSL
ncbi:hypothetical protein LJB99_07065 [Deltaproteobacteria bacterium OttesenSCG-928-K17]|nr:hypothetical protein [Deltaproteobacteria bacterium OttesenSCG-928-K17]